MSQLLLDVRGVSGSEADTGLRNLGMHEQSFVRVLKRFIEVYQPGDPGLVVASGVDGVCEAARGLRNMGETIGALRISWLAKRLQLHGKQGHRFADLRPYVLELNAALSHLAQLIKTRPVTWDARQNCLAVATHRFSEIPLCERTMHVEEDLGCRGRIHLDEV